MNSEQLQRIAEISRGEPSFEAAFNKLVEELGEAFCTEHALEISALWQQHQPPLVPPSVPQQLNGFTTFAVPALMDPFIQRIQTEATIYGSYTHADAAELFARWHKDCIRRCVETDRWHCWDGKRWRSSNAMHQTLDALDHFLGVYGQSALLELEKGGLAKQEKINSAAFRAGAFSLLGTKQELVVHAHELDPNDWWLNTPEGIVDLRTGEIMPHAHEAMCTKMTLFAPMSEEAFAAAWPSSRFARFLQEIFENVPEDQRKELIEFEQQSLGYCLTGDSSIHFLKFWYGEGRNGKSTLGEVLELILGDYAKKVNNQLLMLSKHEHHPTEIANLMGARLVIASEISEGAYLNEAAVKELTGDANLSARFMRQDFFEFRRTHKHLIYGNSKPRLRITDAAIKSRLKLTEFGMNFDALGRMDSQLKLDLIREGSLIMTWLMHGAIKIAQAGVKLPRSMVVDRHTEEYMAENDLIALWIAERCYAPEDQEVAEKIRTRPLTLYEDYREWRQSRGEHAESIQRWSQVLSGRGVQSVAVRGSKMIVGVGLRADRDEF